MQRMSELERCVLGVVALRQPCTPYAVWTVFRDSPSAHWSGSAGSIYPLMRRLEEAALLRSTPAGDGRRSRVYAVTPTGRRRLRAWLRPPLEEAAWFDFDPVRLRVRFLGLVPARERAAFLDDALERMADARATAEATLAASPVDADPWRHATSLGAVRMVEARIAWLETVRDEVLARVE